MPQPPIPTDLLDLWKYLGTTSQPIPVEPEDMRNFVLRIAAAEESLKLERKAHMNTQTHLIQCEEVISTTCEKWLAVIERRKKKGSHEGD